jgi:retron-type reverse transcriptase
VAGVRSRIGDRLIDLHSRVHRGAYRARPSRRVYIPKADGRQRPLGIAALEDKIVQQAVVTILNQIYEVDFKGFSYGFRPGRGPHQALGRIDGGHPIEASELGARCGHSGLFGSISIMPPYS